MVKNALFILLIACSLLPAQQVKVKVKTDSTKYLIGDYIGFSVNIEHPSGITVMFPPLKDSLGKLEFIYFDKVDSTVTSDGGRKINYRFTLTSFDSGTVVIPSFNIPYKKSSGDSIGSVATDSLLLSISSMAVDTSAEIKNIKDPVTEPFNYLWILLIIAVIGLVELAGWLIYKKYFKGRTGDFVVPQKVIPPFEEAILALKELEAKKLWQNGKVKEYHSEITEIVRRYFEKTFSFPALELTSGEIIDCLKKQNLSPIIIDITAGFLENADMVKFAKFVPNPKVNEEMMKQAFAIIEEQKKEFFAAAVPQSEQGSMAE